MPSVHEEAPADIAHYRVAAIDRFRLGVPHPAYSLHDDLAQGGSTHVAGQDGVAAFQRATGGDAVDDLGDMGR